MKKNLCKKCGHSFDEHASDINHPDALICWHGAVTGDGCSSQCKNYEDPEEGK